MSDIHYRRVGLMNVTGSALILLDVVTISAVALLHRSEIWARSRAAASPS